MIFDVNVTRVYRVEAPSEEDALDRAWELETREAHSHPAVVDVQRVTDDSGAEQQ